MTVKEIINSRDRKQEVPDSRADIRIFNGIDLNNTKNSYLSSDINIKVGQFFLYEKIERNFLYYPKIGILLNNLTCDQTIEVEWFDIRRNWEWAKRYEITYDDINGDQITYEDYIGDQRSEIQSLILWDDEIEIYGAWDKLPGWKELKLAYYKTIWFNMTLEEKRDRMINSLVI